MVTVTELGTGESYTLRPPYVGITLENCQVCADDRATVFNSCIFRDCQLVNIYSGNAVSFYNCRIAGCFVSRSSLVGCYLRNCRFYLCHVDGLSDMQDCFENRCAAASCTERYCNISITAAGPLGRPAGPATARAAGQATARARNVTINQYSYKPAPRFLVAPGEAKRGAHFLGFELEVESKGDVYTLANCCDSPDIYCKSDGSLENGVEIVSHPGTWAYWQLSHDWRWFFRIAKHVDSSKTTAGLHVHVSRNSLKRPALAKLAYWFERSRDFVTALSGRQQEDLDYWARIPAQCGQGKLTTYRQDYDAGRRRALNTEPAATVEFRLFTSTVDPDCFFGSLAFVRALTKFADVVRFHGHTDNSRKKCRQDFVAWVKHEAPKYCGKEMTGALKYLINERTNVCV